MDLSGVSPEAAVMAVAQQASSADYAVAALSATRRAQEQEAAALLSLIQSVPLPPGVGENLNVYA